MALANKNSNLSVKKSKKFEESNTIEKNFIISNSFFARLKYPKYDAMATVKRGFQPYTPSNPAPAPPPPIIGAFSDAFSNAFNI